MAKKLIKAAVSTLTEPKQTKTLVEKWQSNKVEEQIFVIKKLIFDIFRAPEQKQKIDTIDALIEFEKKLNLDQGIHRFLPALFKNKTPNCLGKEMQLAAFAELCGAKYYSAGVIKSIAEIDIETTKSLFEKIRKDLEKRGIENDAKFEESLKSQEEMLTIKLNNEIKFHSAIIIQLADLSWAIVDPYGICWGILPEKAQIQMEKIDKMLSLSKYSDLLPGFSLPLYASEELIKSKTLSLLDEWIEKKSIQAENKMRKCKNNDELVEAI